MRCVASKKFIATALWVSSNRQIFREHLSFSFIIYYSFFSCHNGTGDIKLCSREGAKQLMIK